MREIVIRRQKGNRILQKASWAIYYRFRLRELISSIISLINVIEKLASIPRHARINNLDTMRIKRGLYWPPKDTIYLQLFSRITYQAPTST